MVKMMYRTIISFKTLFCFLLFVSPFVEFVIPGGDMYLACVVGVVAFVGVGLEAKGRQNTFVVTIADVLFWICWGYAVIRMPLPVDMALCIKLVAVTGIWCYCRLNVTPELRNMVIWWMIVAGLGQSVIGLLQGFGVLKSFHSEFALTGTFGNPGPFGGYLSVVIALLFSYVLQEKLSFAIRGCVIQAGLGQNVARQAALKAGLPIETPAVTVNVVCGSGLNCVNMAAQMIEAGDADIVVAGGMENMDMAPFALQKARYGYRMGAPMGKSEIVDTMVNDALWDACGFNKHMGMTAENVCTNETYQKKYGYSPITREMLDEFSYNSQLKADKAIKDGAFKDEIVPVVIKGKKGDTVFDTDEGPRLSAPEVLAKLKPAFTKDGIVTAGNSSAINDGAAALVIMSEEKAKELGVKPLATWVAGALAGVEPEVMGLGPIAATKKVMAKTGMSVADMDLIEANEAFAAQSVAVSQALNFDMSKVNVNGGAIALGHPVGASGARILVTLLYAMKHRGAHKGLATLCIGGGMGCATIVEMD